MYNVTWSNFPVETHSLESFLDRRSAEDFALQKANEGFIVNVFDGDKDLGITREYFRDLINKKKKEDWNEKNNSDCGDDN